MQCHGGDADWLCFARAGKDPLYALELIDSLGLHELVFLYNRQETFPASGSSSDAPAPAPDTSSTMIAARILASLLDPAPTTPALHPHLRAALTPPPADSNATSPSAHATTVKRLYLATALLPLYSLAAPDKKKVVWLGEKVVRDGVKWSNHDVDWQRKAREASALLSAGVHRYAMGTDESDCAEMGLLLRHASVHAAPQSQWEISLFWSLVVELAKANSGACSRSRVVFGVWRRRELIGFSLADRGREIEIVAAYNAFVTRVLDFQLDTRAFAPHLLSVRAAPSPRRLPLQPRQLTTYRSSQPQGTNITTLLPYTKGSPAISHIQAFVLKWQLLHPEGNQEQCEAYLRGDAEAEIMALVDKFKRPTGKKK